MSGYLEDPKRCEAIRDDLPEMAFGALSGRRRSDVLSHVASCPRCTSELEGLSTVADALLQLAPHVEPPVGFELRLAERLQATAARRPRRLWRAGALAAAVVAMVILGFGLGARVTAGDGHGTPPSATANLSAAAFLSHGHVLGEVWVSRGNPAWIFMTLTGAAAPGTVKCEVTLSGGSVETVGVFRVSGEYAAWGAPLRAPRDQVRSAQLVASDDTIVASARIPA